MSVGEHMAAWPWASHFLLQAPASLSGRETRAFSHPGCYVRLRLVFMNASCPELRQVRGWEVALLVTVMVPQGTGVDK